MKNILFAFISLLFYNQILAQSQAIKITNIHTGKERIIEVNKRIKLITKGGQKIKGSFKIENDVIVVNNDIQIKLYDIFAFKKDPFLTSLLTSGVIIYCGAITAGFGVLIGGLVDSSAFWLTLPAAGMIYTGIKSPNFNKNYITTKGWRFEIVDTSD
ncbi:hypothetical protein N8Z58_00025 [Flavobacteriaceae bacterium]|nr:hypothetical protein [Flavobacteriaceae bacterium]